MTDILFVEDELEMAQIVTDCLEFTGFSVHHYTNGKDALKHFRSSKPDIVVLDVMMPEVDGFNLAMRIRETDPQTPIIFVTARTQIADVLKGFELGANDYLKKPYSVDELIVRINAQLKRASRLLNKKYEVGNYTFDVVHNTLAINGKSKRMSYRESELLRILFEHRDQIVKRKDILDELWDYESFFTGRSLDVFISRIRSYLKADPAIKIANIRGAGYMLLIKKGESN